MGTMCEFSGYCWQIKCTPQVGQSVLQRSNRADSHQYTHYGGTQIWCLYSIHQTWSYTNFMAEQTLWFLV